MFLIIKIHTIKLICSWQTHFQNEASLKKEYPKSGNELFCTSLAKVFDHLTRMRNQMGQIEIMQILTKHKFADN